MMSSNKKGPDLGNMSDDHTLGSKYFSTPKPPVKERFFSKLTRFRTVMSNLWMLVKAVISGQVRLSVNVNLKNEKIMLDGDPRINAFFLGSKDAAEGMANNRKLFEWSKSDGPLYEPIHSRVALAVTNGDSLVMQAARRRGVSLRDDLSQEIMN